MTEHTDAAGTREVAALLRQWLERRLPDEARAWVDSACAEIAGGAPDRRFFLAFSTAVHRCGKELLDPTPEELEAASAARSGWNPGGWSLEQAARALLVLSLPLDDRDAWSRTLTRVQESADVGEAVALGQILPLLPHAESHVLRARELLRTNITAAFEAVACRNPYPADALPEDAWNQMVLKAMFVGSPIHEIVGLDDRANPALSRMLLDYAHERWAAGRPVDPALWRAVGPHADADARRDLGRLLVEGRGRETRAAALALAACPDPEARELLAGAPELAAAVADGRLTWWNVIESESES